MKRGSIAVSALALTGVGALGLLEVTAAPQTGPSVTKQAAKGRQIAPANSEGGVAGGTLYPDVTASRIGLEDFGSADDFHYYGSATVDGETIRAFSIASTSCNIGTGTAEWMDGFGGRNPVIAQNLYRYHEGKFEQIGMSWLKHSFCAVSEPTCGSCSATGCDTLGVGCADTYWATLNGGPTGLGPRWNKNPQGQGPGGVHNDQYNAPVGPTTIRGRLQIHDDDIIDGAQYVAEIHYVTHDEPLARRFNNASYRKVNVTSSSMNGIASGQGSVVQGKAAIQAWRTYDTQVQVVTVDDDSPNGVFNLGYRVYDNGDGTWDYEYALHNLNSHRGAGSFGVPAPSGVDISNIGFHDVDYHSGDGVNYVTQDGTDWPGVVDASDYLVWFTQSYAENQNANALRWSTTYNFRFTANSPPVEGAVNVGLFRPATVAGQPDSVQIAALVPSVLEIACPADMVSGDTFLPPGDGAIDGADLAFLLGEWGDNPGSPADIVDSKTFLPPSDDKVDGADLAYLLGEWGDCE